jgi:hypothetical protein
MRYLIKRKGSKIDYMSIPKGAVVSRSNKGYIIKKGKRKSIPHKGYSLITAKSLKSAIKRRLI